MSPAAVVVAGGRSRRMGRPKAELKLRGRPLLAHIVDVLRSCCDPVIVVASEGQVLPSLPGEIRRVDDPPTLRNAGPLAGILTGLDALEDHALAFMAAVDTPLLSAQHVADMTGRLGPDIDAVVPRDAEGQPQILASVVRVDVARRRARALVDAGERSARRLFEDLRTTWVDRGDLTDPDAIRSCNTPEQWAQLAPLAEARWP